MGERHGWLFEPTFNPTTSGLPTGCLPDEWSDLVGLHTRRSGADLWRSRKFLLLLEI